VSSKDDTRYSLGWSSAPFGEAKWERTEWPNVLSRDLLLFSASRGDADARHLRSEKRATLPAWRNGDCLVNVVYVLRGEMQLEYTDSTIELSRGDSIYTCQRGLKRWM
jgi:hypothetical protein